MKVHMNTNTHKNLKYFGITDAFLNQKRVNICEHVVKMVSNASDFER